MHFMGISLEGEILLLTLKHYFYNVHKCVHYNADVYNVTSEGVQNITFYGLDSNMKRIARITLPCKVVISEEWNDYTYEIERWAHLS